MYCLVHSYHLVCYILLDNGVSEGLVYNYTHISPPSNHPLQASVMQTALPTCACKTCKGVGWGGVWGGGGGREREIEDVGWGKEYIYRSGRYELESALALCS